MRRPGRRWSCRCGPAAPHRPCDGGWRGPPDAVPRGCASGAARPARTRRALPSSTQSAPARSRSPAGAPTAPPTTAVMATAPPGGCTQRKGNISASARPAASAADSGRGAQGAVDEHTHQRGHEIAHHHRPGLRQRAAGNGEQQHGRGAHRRAEPDRVGAPRPPAEATCQQKPKHGPRNIARSLAGIDGLPLEAQPQQPSAVFQQILHRRAGPVLTKELGGMQRRHAAVTANQGVRRAIPVAAPADALGVGRIHRKPLAHRAASGRSWTSDLSNCGNSTLFSSWMCASKSSANCLVAVQSWTQVRQASPGGVA
jgi:hypothetical protein